VVEEGRLLLVAVVVNPCMGSRKESVQPQLLNTVKLLFHGEQVLERTYALLIAGMNKRQTELGKDLPSIL